MTYIQERLVEKTISYWDPIKKLNLATFSSDAKPVKKKKNEKTKTLKNHQSLFSRLITISRSRDIDFKNVLSYDLVPVPLALFHSTGEMRKIRVRYSKNSKSTHQVTEIFERSVRKKSFQLSILWHFCKLC